MPRRPRLALPGIPLHLIQRGNNRQACFFAEDDHRVHLDWLTEYAGKSGCRVHAYVLMTNHVHLLVSADSTAAPGALMKVRPARSSRRTVSIQHWDRGTAASGISGALPARTGARTDGSD